MSMPSFASLRPTGLVAAASAGVGSSRPPHISIDTNIFSLVDSTGNVKPLPPMILNDQGGQRAMVALDVVFIDVNPKASKIYWGGKEYSPNSVEPPVCWSDNGLAPSVQALVPQSPLCLPCRHNVIGSAISKFSGAKIRACQDFKKLACIVPDDPNGMIYLMQVKPGSFKNWTSYINWLKGQKTPTGAVPDLCDVVTRMSFESQGVLKFEPVALVVEGTPIADRMVEAWSSKRALLDDMVGRTDQPIQGLLGGPQARPLGLQPPPAPTVGSPSIATAPPSTPTGPAAPAASPFSAQPGQGFQMPSQPVNPFAGQQHPAQAQVEKPKRGRPKAASAPAQPGPLPQTSPAEDTDIPPFLRRSANGPQAGQATAPQQSQFGLAQPQAASSDLQAKLADAFKLPT